MFFDGVCGLCNRAINHLIRIDKQHKIYVASLQGETAMKLLPKEALIEVDTIILYQDGKILIKSEAVFEILVITKSTWRWIRFFQFLPKGFLNTIYDLVARNRYKLFGKHETCRIPTVEEKSYFLK